MHTSLQLTPSKTKLKPVLASINIGTTNLSSFLRSTFHSGKGPLNVVH